MRYTNARFYQPQAASARDIVQAAKTARALAIANAMASHAAVHSPPIRNESPRIPSGGIDAVAAKVQTVLHAEAIRLTLDENVDVGSEVEDGSVCGFNGFASARGMKRTMSTEENYQSVLERASRGWVLIHGSGSPTKQSSGGQHGARSGPRRILGEIVEDGPDWSKRHRLG
jgi:hypothetical protein